MRGGARLALCVILGGAGCLAAPEAKLAGAPVGVEVLPTSGPIPENLLRFYVRFSAPMSRGDAGEQVALVGADDTPVEGAFLQIGQELWSADMRTLTLIVDPGRLKQGVEPNLTLGPPLRAGETVTLHVGEGMRDASGTPIGAPVRVGYAVVAADHAGPEPGRWRVSSPVAGTLEPLVVAPEAPVDPVLAPRFLRVQDAGGQSLPGRWTGDSSGQTLRFAPEAPWRAEEHRLAVHPRLEDMAGNRVGARFDMAPGTVARLARGEGEPQVLAFRVQAPSGPSSGER